MTFRFILQPCMAAIAALRDGVNDPKSGRPPYFWALLTNPLENSHRLYEGLIGTARVILLGLRMDAIYQWIVLKTFYPIEAVIVAIVLAFFSRTCCSAARSLALHVGGLTRRLE